MTTKPAKPTTAPDHTPLPWASVVYRCAVAILLLHNTVICSRRAHVDDCYYQISQAVNYLENETDFHHCQAAGIKTRSRCFWGESAARSGAIPKP